MYNLNVTTMAKISREQAEKWSKPCKNGYAFDVYSYLMNGTKGLCKSVYLNEEKTEKLQAEIYHADRWDKNWKKHSVICVNVNRFRLNEEKTFWCGGGLGKTTEYPNDKPKKMLADLYKFTEEWTDDKVKAVWDEATKA